MIHTHMQKWLARTFALLALLSLVATVWAATPQLSWAKRAGGSLQDYGISVATLPDGGSFVTGLMKQSATFGPGEPGQTTVAVATVQSFFLARYQADGSLGWVKGINGGASVSMLGLNVVALSDGGAIVSGGFIGGNAVFGQGEANQTILSAGGNMDIFLARYNANGTLAWAKKIGGNGNDRGESQVVVSGGLLVTGSFENTAVFGNGEANQTTLISSGANDIFLAKYTLDGALVWAKQAGGAAADYSYGVSAAGDGSALVTGLFTDAATFGAGETKQTSLTSAGVEDIFIARFNSDGTLAWVKRAGGPGHEVGYAIAAYTDGSSVVTGTFQVTASFGLGEAGVRYLTSVGSIDTFIARYNANGTLAWARRMGGIANDYGFGITVLPDNGVIITGDFQVDATFGEGEANQTTLTSLGGWDIFLARFQPNGTLSWVKHAGGSGEDLGQSVSAFANGSVVITGYISETATFGIGEAQQVNLTSAGNIDIFLARYSSDLDWPDMQIRTSAEGSYTGDNIYNTTGAGQSKALTVAPTSAATYLFRLQNDGGVADTFKLNATAGSVAWVTRYFTGSGEITSQITSAGGWTTTSIAPGAALSLWVTVTPISSVPAGTSRALTVTATSTLNPTRKDQVRATTTAALRLQPDVHIRTASEVNYSGNDIYNLTGVGQAKAQTTTPGVSVSYLYRVQNDGNVADAFVVTGWTAPAGWTFKYYYGATDITSDVTGTGWNTGTLPIGGSTSLFVVVTPTNTVPGGAIRSVLLTATSVADATKQDVVKGTTTVTASYQPDLQLRTSAEGSYTGDNVYETDGATQAKALECAAGATVTYLFKVQNDANATDTITVTGSSAPAGWTVRYYEMSTNVDVTAQVTSAGYSTGSVVKTGTKGLYVRVSASSGVTPGDALTLLLTATSVTDHTRVDVVKTVTTRPL